MFRVLGILVTVLFAIATAVLVWPQFFRLEQTYPFAQLVAVRGAVALAYGVIVVLALLLLFAKPLRGFATSILIVALIGADASVVIGAVRGLGTDALPERTEGSVRVMINARKPDGTFAPSTINMLYKGQCFGEMILLNSAARSATIVAVEPTTLIVIRESDFRQLCDANPRIGYVVIRNLAQDLAYKLRSSNLLLRGNIRLTTR